MPINEAALIMRVSTIMRIAYWQWTVNPEIMIDVSAEFDCRVPACYEKKLDLESLITATTGRQKSDVIELIRAPLALGGDGIKETTETCWANYIGGVSMATQLPTHLHGFDQYFDGKERPELAIHCHLN